MSGHLSQKPLQCPNCGANVDERSVRCAYCKAVLSQTACPACFAPIFKGMRFCPGCGHAVSRDPLAEKPALACPRCEKPLIPAAIGDTRVDECSICGGIWLDAETFERICADRERQEAALAFPMPLPPSPPDAPDAPGAPGTPGAPGVSNAAGTPDGRANPPRLYVPCPVCSELMNRKNFAGCSGVILDWCKPHGFWFDRQELQRIIDFIRSGGLQKARAMELAKIEAEKRQLRELQFENNHERLNAMQIGTVRELGAESLLADALVAIFRNLGGGHGNG